MFTAVLWLLILLVPSTSLAQSVEMANYETEFAFRGKANAPRAANIELAASLLNGAVIEPGAEWSFNRAVGPRNERHGFQKAKVIVRKRLRKDFGGGVCQVASTLHAAALKAGFEIVEHHPHSRASTYIHPSLDATVAWGSMDLRIRNPHPFPVKVVTSIRSVEKDKKVEKVIQVAILGSSKPNISMYFEIHETKEFETLTLYRRDWKAGRRKVQEPGTLGYKLTRIRMFNQPGGFFVQEARKFFYPPSRRIIILGKPLISP